MNYTFPDTSTHVSKRFRASMCWGMKPHYDQGMGISQINGTRVAAPRATTDDTLWGFVVFHTLAHLSQVTQHPLIFLWLPSYIQITISLGITCYILIIIKININSYVFPKGGTFRVGLTSVAVKDFLNSFCFQIQL